MNRIDRQRHRRKTQFEKNLRIQIGHLEHDHSRRRRAEMKLLAYLDYLSDPDLDGL